MIPGRKSNKTSVINFASAFLLPDTSTLSAYNSIKSPSMYFCSAGWQNHRKKRRTGLGGEGCWSFINLFRPQTFYGTGDGGLHRLKTYGEQGNDQRTQACYRE